MSARSNKNNINFHNNTDFPIIVESFINALGINDVTQLKFIKVDPRKTIAIYSSFGEFRINTKILSSKDRKIWEKKGFNLKKYEHIGEFWSDPYLFHNFNWIEHNNIFKLEYNENGENGGNEENVKNTVIFSQI